MLSFLLYVYKFKIYGAVIFLIIVSREDFFCNIKNILTLQAGYLHFFKHKATF